MTIKNSGKQDQLFATEHFLIVCGQFFKRLLPFCQIILL